MTLKIEPLTGGIGAEVHGVDLSALPDPEVFAVLSEAFLDHGFLLFRGQDLSEAQQVAFGALFGPVEQVRSPDEGAAGAARIRYVANRAIAGHAGILPAGAMDLHSDYCFRVAPYKATMLHCLEAPASGGATNFADTGRAFAGLSPDLKTKISPLRAHHAYGGQATRRPPQPAAENLSYDHPVVIAHPESGRPLLFVNHLMTDHIVGLARDESDALLDQLFEHLERPAYLHSHRWACGDLIVWDNLRLLHGRDDFDAADRRVLRRITISGVPVSGAALL